MNSQMSEHPDEPLAETPEDVAILYSWANLHGAKYRDFSASRREYRAQVRHRAAEELRRAELAAKAQAEASASEADRTAREAERAARSAEQADSTPERENALRTAEEAARRAGAERVEAARRAEAAAIAEANARREEREIAEAHASAERQAKSYGQSELRRRYLAGPQPTPPGLASDPYGFVHTEVPANEYSSFTQAPRRSEMSQIRVRDENQRQQQVSGERRAYRPELEVRRRPQGYRPDEISGIRPAYRAPEPTAQPVRQRISHGGGEAARDAFAPREMALEDRRQPAFAGAAAQPPDRFANPYPYAAQAREREQQVPLYAPVPAYAPQPAYAPLPPYAPAPAYAQPLAYAQPPAFGQAQAQDQPGPAWLYAANATSRPVAPQPRPQIPDTLQQQRERVASRWFALKGAFEPGQDTTGVAPPQPQREMQTPVLAVFSPAGGVGKTSLVATLGRALSSLGEKVLLADTTSQGLLPYYFGASELRPGVVRTFSPPSGSSDAPIHLVSYEAEKGGGDPARQDALLNQLRANANEVQRIVLDLGAGSGWVLRRLAGMNPTVLVPVSPDMNSVISLQTVERFFQGAVDRDGRAILPCYVLNQFDAALPLHLDVREVLRRQLGDRLLPMVVRRAPAVSEALAEGMTVVDYAPDGAITEDYRKIAEWLRKLSPAATQAVPTTRWSER